MPKRGAMLSLLTPYEPEDLVPRKRAKKLKPPRPRAPTPPPRVPAPPQVSAPSESKKPVHDVPAPPPVSHPQNVPVKGYQKYPTWLIDDVITTIPPFEQSVLLRLWRLSWGFHRATCQVSWQTIANRCGMSKNKARQVGRSLQAKGHIIILGVDMANPDKKTRGVIFEVKNRDAQNATPPRRVPGAPGGASKESILNIPLKEPTPEEVKEYEAARAALEGRGGG